MKFLLSALALASAASAHRWIVYYDQYHVSTPEDKKITANITHVLAAFAPSTSFLNDSSPLYQPFKPLNEIRALFDHDVKVSLCIGGWGDNAGFAEALLTDDSRKEFAKNVAATIERLGYDGVDIDLEYTGGNGNDYKQVPNSERVYQIAAFPLFLQDIKAAIGGCKELSVAVPGLERDMIGYTSDTVPTITATVDFINVMTYDLFNRRDNVTKHHSDVDGSSASVDRYIALGADPEKLNLGFASYAKWANTAQGVDCSNGIGCAVVLLEDDKGADTGHSGAVTYEKANYAAAPTNLTLSPDDSCGTGTFYKCDDLNCCSQYGFCGNTTAHCAAGCQPAYGSKCTAVDISASFQKAMANPSTDIVRGAQWYWDGPNSIFWTWDSAAYMKRKVTDIIVRKGLGGGFFYSLGEDTYDWSHLTAVRDAISLI